MKHEQLGEAIANSLLAGAPPMCEIIRSVDIQNLWKRETIVPIDVSINHHFTFLFSD